MAKKEDGHPMMEGPIDRRFDEPSVVSGRYSSLGFPTRPSLSLKVSPSLPGVRPLALPDLLQDKQRGGILQFGLRWVGGQPKVSSDDGEAAWRSAILLCDRLDWPIASNVIAGSADPGGLVQAGIMSRTPIALEGQVTEDQLNHIPFSLFEALDERERGMWSIWAGADEEPIPAHASEPNLAFRLKLNRSLILPHKEVPYTDLVEFKHRHLAKVIKLRHHLERLALQVARNGWDPAETTLEIEALDVAIAAYLEEARKQNWRKILANLEFSMNWVGVAKGAAVAGVVAAAGLPLSGAVLGLGEALTSSIELKSTRGLKVRRSESPFEYLAAIDREFGS